MIISGLLTLNAQAISVEDDTGQTLTLKQPAQRIVSLAPHTTEILYAAGAGNAVVGVVAHSDYPPPARQLPQVGGYDALDLERIVALKPDLIVAWDSGNPRQQLQRLKQLGIPVYFSEPRSIDDIAENILRLGHLSGNTSTAKKAARRLRRTERQLRQRYAGRPKVRVFYQIWHRPLMTINGEHVISDVIRLCGGENVFADLPMLSARIDVEAVLKTDPEVIIASGMGASRPEWLDTWRKWPGLYAARDNLYFIHPDLLQRHGPRIVQGAERLCHILEQVRTKRPSPAS